MLNMEQIYAVVGVNYELDATREGPPFGHQTKSIRKCAGTEPNGSPSVDLRDSESFGEEAGRARFEHATDGLRVRRSP